MRTKSPQMGGVLVAAAMMMATGVWAAAKLHPDPARSKFQIELGTSGMLKFMGDEHLIDVTEYQCEVNFDEKSPASSSVKLVVKAASLKVLDPKLAADKRQITLKCDIHPWMEGWIMVFDHPFFAVTGPDGSFEIRGVPAGKQQLILWQESTGFVTPGASRGREVDVKADGVTDLGEIKLDPAKVKS